LEDVERVDLGRDGAETMDPKPYWLLSCAYASSQRFKSGDGEAFDDCEAFLEDEGDALLDEEASDGVGKPPAKPYREDS
jgi:hypothetical protein